MAYPIIIKEKIQLYGGDKPREITKMIVAACKEDASTIKNYIRRGEEWGEAYDEIRAKYRELESGDELVRERKRNQEFVNELGRKINEINKLNNNIQTITNERDKNWNNLIQEQNKTKQLEIQITNKDNDISQKDKDIVSLNTKLAQEEDRTGSLRELNKRLIKDITDTRQLVSHLQKDLQTEKQDKAHIQKELDDALVILNKPATEMKDAETQTDLTYQDINKMENDLTKFKSKFLGSLFSNKLAKKKAWNLENRLSILAIKVNNLAKEKQSTLDISSELKERVVELENSISKGEGDLHVAELEIKRIEELFKQKEQELIQFQEIKETEWTELATKIKDLEKLAEERGFLLKGVELELNNARIELEKFQEQIPLLEQDKNDLEKKLKGAQDHLNTLNSDLNSSNETISNQKELVKIIQNDLTNTKNELANSQKQAKNYQAQTVQLEKDLATAKETTKREEDKNKNSINQLNVELTKLRNADKDRSSLLSTAQSQVSNLISEKSGLQNSVNYLNSSITNLNTQIKNKDATITKLNQEKQQIQNSQSSVQNQLNQLRNQGILSQQDKNLLAQITNYSTLLYTYPYNFASWQNNYNWFNNVANINNSGAKQEIINLANYFKNVGNTFKIIIDYRNQQISQISTLQSQVSSLTSQLSQNNSLIEKLNYYRASWVFPVSLNATISDSLFDEMFSEHQNVFFAFITGSVISTTKNYWTSRKLPYNMFVYVHTSSGSSTYYKQVLFGRSPFYDSSRSGIPTSNTHAMDRMPYIQLNGENCGNIGGSLNGSDSFYASYYNDWRGVNLMTKG